MVPYNSLVLLLHINFGAILVQGANSFGNGPGNGLKVDYEWTTVDFVWPDAKTKEKAVKKGRHDPTRIAILDVDVYNPADFGHYNNAEQKIFVTTPKFQPGIPVTLSTVSKQRAKDGSNLLEPFPNWSSHSEKDCDGLTSVYRVQIDECERLWVLDTGKLSTFTLNPQQLCPPQIVVYDLKNNYKVILRHKFPEDQLEANSLLITIAVDSRNKCSSQFAYIADVNGYQMLVYDATKRKSWRITSNYFHPFPTYGAFDLNGAQFDLMDGVFAIALGPLVNNNRQVYFHALASLKEGWTDASSLLNQSLFENNLTPTALFQLSEYDRNSQSSSEVMSNEGIMFFPMLISNSLVCWNSKTTYKQENFVTLYKNDKLFQFVSGIKLKANRDLYVLTSRLQNYIVTGLTDTSQVNYRILTARTGDLTRNTPCGVTRFDASDYLHSAGTTSSYGGNVNTHYRPHPRPITGSGFFFNAQGSKFTSNYGGVHTRFSMSGAVAQSMPSAGAQSMPGAWAQSMPGAGAQSMPGAGAQSMPGAWAQSMPGAGAQPMLGAAAQQAPVESHSEDIVFPNK